MLLKAVLARQKSFQWEVAQPVDVLVDEPAGESVPFEELLEVGARDRVVFGHGAQQFNHLSQVVVRFRIVLSLARVEQEVSRDQFENHARETPQVSACVVVDAEHDFWSSVLSRLNSLREVVMRPAPISKIADLQRNVLVDEGATFVHVLVKLLLRIFLFFHLVLLEVLQRKIVLDFTWEVSDQVELPRAVSLSSSVRSSIRRIPVLVLEKTVFTAFRSIPPSLVRQRLAAWKIKRFVTLLVIVRALFLQLRTRLVSCFLDRRRRVLAGFATS